MTDLERQDYYRLRFPGAEITGNRARLPDGSVTWKQGMFWKWIPREDFQDGAKPRTLPKGVAPIGAKNTGLRTPQETVQVIGEGEVPDFRVDLGKVDLTISNQAQTIAFAGGGANTNIGERIDSTLAGMTVGTSEPKGHAYARKVFPAHSVSRTAITDDTDKPTRRRSELHELRPGIQDDDDSELVTDDELFTVESDTKVMNPFTGKMEQPGSFGDEIRHGKKRKSVNRNRVSKSHPVRGRRTDTPSEIGGIRL